MFGLNCWQLFVVLLRPVCYGCICATKISVMGLNTGVALLRLWGWDLQEPKLRDSCGVQGCFLQVGDYPT